MNCNGWHTYNFCFVSFKDFRFMRMNSTVYYSVQWVHHRGSGKRNLDIIASGSHIINSQWRYLVTFYSWSLQDISYRMHCSSLEHRSISMRVNYVKSTTEQTRTRKHQYATNVPATEGYFLDTFWSAISMLQTLPVPSTFSYSLVKLFRNIIFLFGIARSVKHGGHTWQLASHSH